MSNSCNVWGLLANESIPLKSGGRGDLALNSLLRTWLSLKRPSLFRDFKQLECMNKCRVSFWWTWTFLLLNRNQEVTLREPWVRAEFFGDIYFSWVSLRCVHVGSWSPMVRFSYIRLEIQSFKFCVRKVALVKQKLSWCLSVFSLPPPFFIVCHFIFSI